MSNAESAIEEKKRAQAMICAAAAVIANNGRGSSGIFEQISETGGAAERRGLKLFVFFLGGQQGRVCAQHPGHPFAGSALGITKIGRALLLRAAAGGLYFTCLRGGDHAALCRDDQRPALKQAGA